MPDAIATNSQDEPGKPGSRWKQHQSRVVRALAWLVTLPLWLIVLGVAALMTAAWMWPYTFAEASRATETIQTGFFLARAFQFHIACLLVGCGVFGWLLGRKWLALLAVLVAMPMLVLELMLIVPNFARPSTAGGPELRVASMNLYFYNDDNDALFDAAVAMDADVLVLQEFIPSVRQRLHHRLREIYPNVLLPGQMGGQGRAIYSRYPLDRDLEHPNVHDFAGRRRVVVLVGEEQARLALYSVHNRSPGGVDTVARNFEQVGLLVEERGNESLPAVYLGDFNASTWTPQLSLLRSVGMVEAHDQTEWGRGTTWPTERQRSIVRLLPHIRIDNIFLDNGVIATNAGIGPPSGSDHLPIWADVQLP